jgi:hypothetical protein
MHGDLRQETLPSNAYADLSYRSNTDPIRNWWSLADARQGSGDEHSLVLLSNGDGLGSRADDACPDRSCAHARCWRQEAHVSELTGLLRDGPAGDQLAGWPAGMRIFARRERPHPGAQLSLFEEAGGWRYSL